MGHWRPIVDLDRMSRTDVPVRIRRSVVQIRIERANMQTVVAIATSIGVAPRVPK